MASIVFGRANRGLPAAALSAGGGGRIALRPERRFLDAEKANLFFIVIYQSVIIAPVGMGQNQDAKKELAFGAPSDQVVFGTRYAVPISIGDTDR